MTVYIDVAAPLFSGISTGSGLLRKSMPVTQHSFAARWLIRYVLARPGLYGPALRAAWRFRDRNWFRRPPFLPFPPAEYLAWRMETAYGESGEPAPDEVGRFLRWAVRHGGQRTSVEVG